MRKRYSLLANYMYNLLSQLLALLMPMITAPYLARVLHEVGNGQVAFTNSIVAYFVSFAGFGFSLYGQREIAKHKGNHEKINRIFAELLVLRIIFSAISTTVLGLFIISPLIEDGYKILVLINSIQIMAVIFDIQFYYQGIEDFKSIAFRTIIIRLASIICVFTLVKTQDDVWKYLLYTSLIQLLANVAMWPKVVREIKPVKIHVKNLKDHLKPSLFVFLPILSGTIFSVLDSTMIGYLSFNPEYENGCYGSALKIVNLISTIVVADGLILASRNARDYAIGDIESVRRHLKLGFRYVWLVGFPIMAGIAILSDRISFWFFGEGYLSVPNLLRIFTLRVFTHGIMNVIGNQYLIPTGREKVCTVINFFGIAGNILLNVCLIPLYGSVGAAIASITAESILVVLYARYFIKEHRFWNESMIVQCTNYAISTAIMCLVIMPLNYIFPNKLLALVATILVGAAIYGISLILMKDDLFVDMLQKTLHKCLKKV